jgi:hypothetical protein
MKVTNLDEAQVETTILNETTKKQFLQQFNGKQDNSLRKKWTARTFELSNGKVLIEFYDKQAALIKNRDDFKKLDRVRFVKNTVNFLKKNISYKIELSYEEGNRIIQDEKPKRLINLKSDMPGQSVQRDHSILLEADHSVSLQIDRPFSLQVDHL